MAWQDVMSDYTHRDDNDDGPRRKTVPDRPQPGQRFMRAAPWSWDVCDWEAEACDCYDGTEARKDCPLCKGTGEGALVPATVAVDLTEADARLLTFGRDMLAALEFVLASTAGRGSAMEAVARAAIAKARGT